MAFYTRLRALRVRQNLTSTEMARLLQVPKSTYSDWENGKRLNMPPLLKISQILSISVTELITGEQPNHQTTLNKIVEIEKILSQIKANIASVT